MRSLISSILVVVLAVLAPTIAMAQAISVTPDSWDFGRMEQRETRTATVMVENVGAGRLIIEHVYRLKN